MTTIDPAQIKNNYANPLDAYRSYSYQFILTLSSTTQAFAEMIGNYKGGRGGPVSSASPLLAAVRNAKKPGDAFTVNGQTAYLLVDTRRFSQYGITNLEMEHVYGAGSQNNPSVPANTTSMELIDTTGMSFFNMLMETFREKLQTTRASAFFLLTILFTGHKDDGTTETISTCFIPLILLTMEFTLDHRGTTFQIQFMETEGGPQRGAAMEVLNYMGGVRSITSKGTSSTIGGMLSSLEKQLNIKSLEFYNKYTNTAQSMNGGTATKSGKLVQYMITVNKDWEQFPVSLAGRSKYREQTFTAFSMDPVSAGGAFTAFDQSPFDGSGDGLYAQMAFSETTLITDAIKTVLEASPDFLALSSEEKVKAGTASTNKILINITCDDDTYVVHFDVLPYFLPKVNTDKKDEPANTVSIPAGGKSTIGGANEIKNLITYDYIFTGKNSHIKNLDIKYLPESAIALDTNLQLGQARLAYNANIGQTTAKVKEASESTATKSASYAPDIRGSDPIFFSYRSQDQKNNIATHKNEQMPKDEAIDALRKKQEYTNTMAYVHFISSLELTATVRGNPNIIKKFADRNERGGVPPHSSIIDAKGISNLNDLINTSNNAEAVYNQKLQQGVSTAKGLYYSKYVAPRIKAYTDAHVPGSDPLLSGPDISVNPVFCKLNIFAPNVDSMGDTKRNEDGSQQSLFTDEFFFNGPYMVLYIKTTFTNGEFEHVITMIPYIVSDTLTKSNGAPKPTGTTVK